MQKYFLRNGLFGLAVFIALHAFINLIAKFYLGTSFYTLDTVKLIASKYPYYNMLITVVLPIGAYWLVRQIKKKNYPDKCDHFYYDPVSSVVHPGFLLFLLGTVTLMVNIALSNVTVLDPEWLDLKKLARVSLFIYVIILTIGIYYNNAVLRIPKFDICFLYFFAVVAILLLPLIFVGGIFVFWAYKAIEQFMNNNA